MESSKKNSVYKLPNNLGLKILGNLKIMGETQKCVETP